MRFIVGGLFVGMSVRRSNFEKTFGPALAARYELNKRIYKSAKRSERSVFNTARAIFIAFCSLLIVVGIVSFVERARGLR